MKYFNVDKLKELIDEKWKELADKNVKAGGGKWDAEISTYLSVLNLIDSLQQEQPEGLHFTPLNRLIQKIPSENWNDTVNNYAKKLRDCLIKEGYRKDAEVLQGYISYMNGNNVPMVTMDGQEQPKVADSSKMEQSEVDLEKFTEKIKTFQGRYKYPEIVSIKGAMAFMARMFYQYPNIARQWYDSLSKATMD